MVEVDFFGRFAQPTEPRRALGGIRASADEELDVGKVDQGSQDLGDNRILFAGFIQRVDHDHRLVPALRQGFEHFPCLSGCSTPKI